MILLLKSDLVMVSIGSEIIVNFNNNNIIIIGASLSKPHTICYYEKIAVLMYVCLCVFVSVICHPRAVLVHAIYVRSSRRMHP